MTDDDPWLAATWPFVRDQLPAPSARVLEIGCGPLGGFIPALIDAGYRAVGVDPAAPDAPEYERLELEEFSTHEPFHAVVACTSLHHVHDLDAVIDRIDTMLVPGSRVLVIEWAWERFDEASARWCFDRLGTPSSDDSNWLQRHHDGWTASGRPWDTYFAGWAREHGLHPGVRVVEALDRRFDRCDLRDGPYFFADVADTSEADEQAAIDAGEIRPTGLYYVGATR